MIDLMKDSIQNPVFKMIISFIGFCIVDIAIPIGLYKLFSKIDRKSGVPIMHIMCLKGKGKELHRREIEKYKCIIKLSYIEHEGIDGNYPSRKEIKFERVSIENLMEVFVDSDFVVINFVGEKEVGLTLYKVFDSLNAIYDIDEEIVPLTKMANGEYCIVCKTSDKPYSIKGAYHNHPVSYNIRNVSNDYIKPKIKKQSFLKRKLE